jgi:hypothetical protein
VSLFLSGLPLWVMAMLLVVLPTFIAAAILILIRNWIGLARLTTNNEVAGFKFSVVGVIYAVLLAFAVIVVWGRYNDAEEAVIKEAGAAATLYRLAAGLQPEARGMRTALNNYLHLASERDWPQMAVERESPDVTVALNQLYASAIELAKEGARESAVDIAIFNQLDALTEARRARLHLAIGIVPVVLWVALSVGGILTVGFTFFFAAENLKAQVLMTCILAIIVFMGLFVIIAIDHPFTGPVHIDPWPLQLVLRDFGGEG